MRIYRIVPLDSKGEIDGNEWFTQWQDVALKESLQGHSVMVAEVVAWKTVQPTFEEV